MSKRKIELFKKGDVVRTNPAPGYYGIAVVLDDGVKQELSPGKWSYPMCHIAITPLLYDYEVEMEDIDHLQIYPMKYMRGYELKNTTLFWKEELLVHIYTTRNMVQLPVIGNIDPIDIYKEELLWKPQSNRFYYCGDTQHWLGIEAYLDWYEKNKIAESKTKQ